VTAAAQASTAAAKMARVRIIVRCVVQLEKIRES
jgi:hypothetical protein